MSTKTDYGFGTKLDISCEEAIARIKDALKTEGFGILTEIDVRQTLHDKIGEEIEPYIILGACNPKLAHRALGAEREIGLMLPCNVVVRSAESGTIVEIVDPQAMLGISGNDALRPVAAEAKERLERALGALTAQG